MPTVSYLLNRAQHSSDPSRTGCLEPKGSQNEVTNVRLPTERKTQRFRDYFFCLNRKVVAELAPTTFTARTWTT